MLTKLWVMTIGVFFISFIAATTPVTALVLKELPIQNETLTWRLAGAVGGVSDQINTRDESVSPENYTIKVKAAKNYTLVLEDRVHLTVATCSPNSGLSERREEHWSVQNSQIITENELTSEAIKVRYNH